MNSLSRKGSKLPGMKAVIPVLIFAVMAAALSIFMSPYKAFATVAYLLLVTGLIQRKHRLAHRLYMSSGILIDLLILCTLEITRDAFATASSMSLALPQMIHIGSSSAAVLLYIPVLFMGISMSLNAKYKPKYLKFHKGIGLLAFAARSIGLVFMFTMAN